MVPEQCKPIAEFPQTQAAHEFAITREGFLAASSMVENWTGRFGYPDASAHRLNVILDEHWANLLRHDAESIVGGAVSIALKALDPNEFHVRMTSPGQRFDPVSAPLSDGKAPGGQGLRILREMARKLTYEWNFDQNCLEFTIIVER